METQKHLFNRFRLIVIIIVFGSCSQNTKSVKFNNLKKANNSRIEYKDSLYIMYTIEKWMDVNFDLYHDYSKDNIGIKKSDIKYKIVKIFYSPDKLKFFCWITNREPNTPDCMRTQGYSYSSSDIVGFRQSLKETWKVYPLELIKAVCFDTEDEVINEMSKYYFSQMKDKCESVNKKFLDYKYGGKIRYDLQQMIVDGGYDDTDSLFILKNYGYNLQDVHFWSKSLIWQKGARIPGLYNFQTKGNVTPDDKDAKIVLPLIKYPDFILRLYKDTP